MAQEQMIFFAWTSFITHARVRFCFCVKVDKIKERLLDRIEGVVAIHEFHVWQLAGNRIIASGKLHCWSVLSWSQWSCR